jgi:hypothetical protein
MGKTLLGLAAAAGLAASFLFSTGAASADPYRWCAVYGGDRGGGGGNCGFVTLEQCRATISGIGGFCRENLFYTGSQDRPIKRIPKRHRD